MQEAIAQTAEILELRAAEPEDLVFARQVYLAHCKRVRQIRALFAQVREHVVRVDIETLVSQLTEYAFCRPQLPYAHFATRGEVASVLRRELHAAFGDREVEVNGRQCYEMQPFFRPLELPAGGSSVHQLGRIVTGREEVLGMLRAEFLAPGHLPPMQLSSDELRLLISVYTGRTGAMRCGMQLLRYALDAAIELLQEQREAAWTYGPQVLEDLKTLRGMTLDIGESAL
jgi:hypothetical protein